MTVLVVGASHLSIAYGLFMSNKGIRVSFWDPAIELNHDAMLQIVNSLEEPGIVGTYIDNSSSIDFLNELDSLTKFELVLVALDTQTNSNNIPDYGQIESALNAISHRNYSQIPVIVLSQVYPGFTRSFCTEFPLFHMVETLVFGEALKRLDDLEIFLVGVETATQSHPELPSFFSSLFTISPNYVNYESSELAKISINVIIGFQILAANLLADIAEQSNANWASIEPILRNDRRIGKNAYIRPEVGFLGDNIPRDFAVLSKLFGETNLANARRFISEAILFNSSLISWITDKISEVNSNLKFQRIGLLGIAYKQGTSSIKNSVASTLSKLLDNYTLEIYEPGDTSKLEYLDGHEVVREFKIFLESSDVIVVCRRDSRFGELITSALDSHIVLDPFRNIPLDDFASIHPNYKTRGKR